MWKEFGISSPCLIPCARTRFLSPQTDVFLVAYSVVGPSSHSNVQTKWVPELQHHASGVPFILVGEFGRQTQKVAGAAGRSLKPELPL